MDDHLSVYQHVFVQNLQDKGKSHSTQLAYGKDIDQFILFLRSIQIESAITVQQAHIEQFAADLRKKRYTEKSIVRKLNSIKGFLSFLVSKNVLSENPASLLKKPKIDQSAPRILSKMEYRALRDACRGDRRGDDLLLDQQKMTVREPETGESRVIPLNASAIRAIREYQEIRPKTKEKIFFVTKTCKPFLVRNIRSAIDRYFKLAGVENARVNDLRHTFIVGQLSAGMPLLYVSQIVGHKRLSTTEKYLQFLDKTMDSSKVKVEEL